MPAFVCDYDARMLVSNFCKPQSDITIWDKWKSHFAGINEVAVCLSGGLDSQFAAWILLQLGVKVRFKTYVTLWEDNVVNANDVLMSTRFSDRMGVPLDLVELDYEQFLSDKEHFRLGQLYRCNSPQLTLHLKFLETLGNSMPLIMGGEAPKIFYNTVQQVSVVGEYQPAAYTQPFENFAAATRLHLTRDLFRIDAETQYLGFEQYCDSVGQHRHYVEDRTDNRTNGYVARTEFYRSFGTPLVPMLYKNNGFETVKKTLACRSGVYNQYDILYRHPLEAALMRENWYGIFSTPQHYHRGEFNNLMARHSEICQQPDMTAVNIYSMDF